MHSAATVMLLLLTASDLAVISALLDDLWRHPVGCTDEGVPLAHGVAQLCRHAKVSNFDLPGICQQDVAALDITMHLKQSQTCNQRDIAQAGRADYQSMAGVCMVTFCTQGSLGCKPQHASGASPKPMSHSEPGWDITACNCKCTRLVMTKVHMWETLSIRVYPTCDVSHVCPLVITSLVHLQMHAVSVIKLDMGLGSAR